MNKHWDQTTDEAEPPVPASAPVKNSASAARWTSDKSTADPLHFLELVNLLRRRKRLILTIALCGAMLVFTVGLLKPPKYTATAQIAVDLPSGSAQAAAVAKDEGSVETHMTILLSRDNLQHVVDNLRDDPQFQTAAPAVHRIETERAADREPRHATSARWLPGPSELAHRLRIWVGGGSSGEPTLDVDELKRHLRVDQEGRSRVIAVSYTSTDSDAARTIANRIAELYVESQSEKKRAYASNELIRFDSRIAEMKTELEQSSAAVQAFMRKRIDAAKQTGTTRESEQHLQELERQAMAKGQLYRALLRRQQEIRDLQESITSGAYILSLAATPERPSSPNPFLFIFPTLVVLLVCGSLLAVILERLDRGLRSESEVSTALGVSCIGLVPQVAKPNGTRRLHQYLVTEPMAAYAEAMRSIVATRQLLFPFNPSRVILITSSLPAEGKTTMAVSLSVSLTLLGQRVLLIDLDFKNPSILHELGGKAEQGLLDVLLKNHTLADVIQSIPELGLDYLPMSRSTFDPQILFDGNRMQHLLRQLRRSYDYVIIDSPPVLASAETRLLAAMADENLFVVKWGSTPRELAQNALNLLRRPNRHSAQQLRHVSALISQVDLKKHSYYGYGDAGEYFSNYGNYYYSAPDGERPAITFSSSYAPILANGSAGTNGRMASAFAWLRSHGAGLTLALLRRYRRAIFRIRLFRLLISTSLTDAWSRLGRRHSKPVAGANSCERSSIEVSQ
jgi:succinoglycan biosynthesis transport protein ExoP